MELTSKTFNLILLKLLLLHSALLILEIIIGI